jgi:chromosome segregation ATPase
MADAQPVNPVKLFQSGLEKCGKTLEESNEAVDKKSLELDEAERTVARLKGELVELQNIRFKASMQMTNVYQRLVANVSFNNPNEEAVESDSESESEPEPEPAPEKKKKVRITEAKKAAPKPKAPEPKKKKALKKIKEVTPEAENPEETKESTTPTH